MDGAVDSCAKRASAQEKAPSPLLTAGPLFRLVSGFFFTGVFMEKAPFPFQKGSGGERSAVSLQKGPKNAFWRFTPYPTITDAYSAAPRPVFGPGIGIQENLSTFVLENQQGRRRRQETQSLREGAFARAQCARGRGGAGRFLPGDIAPGAAGSKRALDVWGMRGGMCRRTYSVQRRWFESVGAKPQETAAQQRVATDKIRINKG